MSLLTALLELFENHEPQNRLERCIETLLSDPNALDDFQLVSQFQDVYVYGDITTDSHAEFKNFKFNSYKYVLAFTSLDKLNMHIRKYNFSTQPYIKLKLSDLMNIAATHFNTCKQTTIIRQPIKTMQSHTTGPNLTQKNTTDKIRKNYGNIFDISHLSGHQKNVFSYLVDRAKFFGSQSIKGDRLTPAIKASELVCRPPYRIIITAFSLILALIILIRRHFSYNQNTFQPACRAKISSGCCHFNLYKTH